MKTRVALAWRRDEDEIQEATFNISNRDHNMDVISFQKKSKLDGIVASHIGKLRVGDDLSSLPWHKTISISVNSMFVKVNMVRYKPFILLWKAGEP